MPTRPRLRSGSGSTTSTVEASEDAHISSPRFSYAEQHKPERQLPLQECRVISAYLGLSRRVVVVMPHITLPGCGLDLRWSYHVGAKPQGKGLVAEFPS